MSKPRATGAREQLLAAGIDLFRRLGYVATTVDEICARAGVTKGAFFHHFDSKEALAEACLQRWDCQAAAMEEAAPFQAIDEPLEKVIGYMDFYIGLFEDPGLLKSCLAGTTVQEVSETHATLRQAAQACFVHAERRFKALLDDACRSRRGRLDTASLATLWMAAIQGSLVLYKASRDESVLGGNLRHVKEYIRTQLAGGPAR
jgi:TetR/AcrR family transcriptional repressor of nem operon